MAKYIQTSFLTKEKRVHRNCQVLEYQIGDRFCVLNSGPFGHPFRQLLFLISLTLWTKHSPRHSVGNRYCCMPFPPFLTHFLRNHPTLGSCLFPLESTFYILTSKAILAACNHFLILQHKCF